MAEAATLSGPEAAPAKGGLKALVIPLLALGLGAGGAAGYFLFLAPSEPVAAPVAVAPVTAPSGPSDFIELNRMLVPVVDQSGRLRGHMTMDMRVEVVASQTDMVKRALPLVRHGINVAFSTAALADAEVPTLIDYKKAAPVLKAAAARAVQEAQENAGEVAIPAVVRAVHIISAMPV